ncbi:hypothetical protein RQP46_009535 [Phenoliferia psychrophenolica]
MFVRQLRQTLRRSLPRQPISAVPRRTLFWSSAAPVVTHLSTASIPSVAPNLLLPLLAALLLASDSDDLPNDPPWTPTDMTKLGKGIGCLAARALSRGDLLIAERPLCIWPQGLTPQQAEELFAAMSDKQKEVFMQLAKTEGKSAGMSEVLARRATNGFSIKLPGSGKTVGMIFPRIARLNHSCLPNCSQAFNVRTSFFSKVSEYLIELCTQFETLRMEVYPVVDVAPQEEVTIEYLPSLIIQPHATRQISLRSSFGFDGCLCPACTASPDAIAVSDSRRLEIRSLSQGLIGGRTDRTKTLSSMERIRVLLEEEGYNGLPEFEDPAVSNAYAVYAGMHARAQRTTDVA